MFNRLLSVIVIVTSLTIVRAQSEYIPLVVEGAHWKVCQGIPEQIWPCGRILEYYIKGDSLLDGVAYKRLYLRDFEQNGEPGGAWNSYDWPLELANQTEVGLIREDISGRKIYWRDTASYTTCESETEEQLLYDFTLEIGDTLQTCLFSDYPAIVQQITTEVLYGMERTVYYFQEGLRLIEGIGYDTGLLEPPILTLNVHPSYVIDYCRGNDMDCGIVHPMDMINPYHQWHLLNESYGFGNGHYSLVTAAYRLHDTIRHDGHLYFKLQIDTGGQEDPTEWVDVDQLYAFRQEGNHIYRYPDTWWDPDSGEKLIYDFDLSVGEEFPLDGLMGYLQPMIVRAIDTIVLDNGTTRRRFNFAPEEWEDSREWYWLEGIGANDHPFTPEDSFIEDIDGTRVQIQCFYRSDNLETPIWHNPEYLMEGCYTYIVNTQEVMHPPKRIVYPNPTSSHLRVAPSRVGDSLVLYSSTGQLLLREKTTENGILQLDLRGLVAGLYVWEVLDAKGLKIQMGRVVKQ